VLANHLVVDRWSTREQPSIVGREIELDLSIGGHLHAPYRALFNCLSIYSGEEVAIGINNNQEIWNTLDMFHLSSINKKIWCASWARVNLPHISNKKYIKFVLQRNLLKKTQGLSFFSRNLYRRYRWDVKYQNSVYFCSWTPK
jgi:hypothetical protein